MNEKNQDSGIKYITENLKLKTKYLRNEESHLKLNDRKIENINEKY